MKTVYLIRTQKEMRALKAPTRQEIVDVLAPMGKASIAEIAAVLGRPADALYYHIRILQKAGLVLDAGERAAGTRSERLYRAVAPDMRLAYEPGSKGNGKSVTAIVGSMLRLTKRDFTEGFRNPKTIVDGDGRELWATRTTGWLTEQQLHDVNRYIHRLIHTTSASSSRGRLYALTMVLTPLKHRVPRRSSTAPSPKRAAKTKRTSSNPSSTRHGEGNHDEAE